MIWLSRCIGFLLLFSMYGNLSAESIEHTAKTGLEPTETNWVDTLNVPKFDPSLGVLTEVVYTLHGYINGVVRTESNDASPSTATARLSAEISITNPFNSTTVVVVIPFQEETRELAAYDGVLDFGGTSGFILDNMQGEKTDNASVTTDLDQYYGPGQIAVPVAATATTSVSGPGNATNWLTTRALASLTVTYVYEVASVFALGDKVWHDLNADGIQDDGEPGIGGVSVELYGADNTKLAETETLSDGSYGFGELLPGSYYVKFFPPAGYELSPTDANSNLDDTLDSDAKSDGTSGPVTLDGSGNNYTLDAGLYKPDEENPGTGGGSEGEPKPIPVFGPWALALLILLLSAVAFRRQRRGH